MAFGLTVRAKRTEQGIRPQRLRRAARRVARLLVARQREQEKPPRDELVERAAAILSVRMDDLFVEAGRLPPDMQSDLKQVVQAYRRLRQQVRQ